MYTFMKSAVLVVGLAVAGGAVDDDDRSDHFKGLLARDLQTAVANFSEYNRLFEQELSGELSNANLAKIHQLTYTLEVALEKIKDELDELADALEDVHLASESYNREAMQQVAAAYIETAPILIQ